jgi:hypothetical protein
VGPDWVLLVVISVLGLLAVGFGVHGFKAEGIPFSPGIRIAGVAGKVVGVLCLVLGLALLWWAGRVFGPREDDAVVHAFVQRIPLGVAAYAVVQILWFSRRGSTRPKESAPRRRPPRDTSKKKEAGIIECPHCGKQMVDTAQERCRFCGEELA